MHSVMGQLLSVSRSFCCCTCLFLFAAFVVAVFVACLFVDSSSLGAMTTERIHRTMAQYAA